MNCCCFDQVLRKLRKNANLTQEELGRHVGLSKAVVSKYETGMGYPAYDVLIRIANYFGVTTDYLLGVSRGTAIDVSGLTGSQIDAIHRLVTEFRATNSKDDHRR